LSKQLSFSVALYRRFGFATKQKESGGKSAALHMAQ
jgi:hypothetical protein